jgi:hypothetical protein
MHPVVTNQFHAHERTSFSDDGSELKMEGTPELNEKVKVDESQRAKTLMNKRLEIISGYRSPYIAKR